MQKPDSSSGFSLCGAMILAYRRAAIGGAFAADRLGQKKRCACVSAEPEYPGSRQLDLRNSHCAALPERVGEPTQGCTDPYLYLCSASVCVDISARTGARLDRTPTRRRHRQDRIISLRRAHAFQTRRSAIACLGADCDSGSPGERRARRVFRCGLLSGFWRTHPSCARRAIRVAAVKVGRSSGMDALDWRIVERVTYHSQHPARLRSGWRRDCKTFVPETLRRPPGRADRRHLRHRTFNSAFCDHLACRGCRYSVVASAVIQAELEGSARGRC